MRSRQGEFFVSFSSVGYGKISFFISYLHIARVKTVLFKENF